MQTSRYEVEEELRSNLNRRLAGATAALLSVVVIGGFGYHYLGEGRWSLVDCFYMAVITLSTVGFAETLPGMNAVAGARIFTVALIVFGSGTLLYFVSHLTAFVVEGDLQGALRRTRMQKRIDGLTDHIVVCGVGTTGIHVVEELLITEAAYVAVDTDEGRLRHLHQELGPKFLYVVGDATDDDVLEQAGIRRARGVVAALHEDKDNLFVAVTARALNGKARIVAKAVESTAGPKLRRAGADAVVSPNLIGGMRMVSEMVRPRVVEFLDLMLRDREKNLRIEEIPIPAESTLAGHALKDTTIRRVTDVLVIAVRRKGGGYVYNPGPDFRLEDGMTLIVMAQTADIIRLREGIASGKIGAA